MECFYLFLAHVGTFYTVSSVLTILGTYISTDKRLSKKFLVQPKIRYGRIINTGELVKLVKVGLINQLFITYPMIYIFWTCYWKDNNYEPQSTVLSWLFTILFEDILFYTFHRILHTKYLYKNIHSLHHTWTAPTPFEAMYSHPLDHLLINVLPVMIAPILGGLPKKHCKIFGIISAISASMSHSGFIHLGSGFHDKHHSKLNVNYGVMKTMDTFFGTID